MSFTELFNPGERYTREQQDWEHSKIEIMPVPGTGPDGVAINLDAMTATIENIYPNSAEPFPIIPDPESLQDDVTDDGDFR